MQREARFTVPQRIWDQLDPRRELEIDGLGWELYDSDDRLVDLGNSVNLSHSPTERGERFIVTYDVDIPDDVGTYELYMELERAFSYTEFIERQDEEYAPEDHLTTSGRLSLDIDRATYGDPDTIPWELHNDVEMVASGEITASDECRIALDVSDRQPMLDPYSLLVGTGDESAGYTDHRIFHVNAPILSVARDLRSRIDRLNRRARLDSLQFADTDYLLWLLLGRDRFNAVTPVTDFTMSNATGPIRQYWLDAAMIEALRVKYLEESLTQYEYGGAAINLSVDVTQALEALASTMEQRLEQATQMKKVMAIRGLVGGDGRWTLRNRNTGVIGVTQGPVTGYRRGWLHRRAFLY